jgi:hypothetical protein
MYICRRSVGKKVVGKKILKNEIAVVCERHGCQMAYFQTKNPIVDKFLVSRDGRCSYIFMPICFNLRSFWYILWKFGVVYGNSVYIFHVLVSLVVPRKIWQPWWTALEKSIECERLLNF